VPLAFEVAVSDVPSRRGFLRGGVGALGAALFVPRAAAEPDVRIAPAAPAPVAPAASPAGFSESAAVRVTVNGTPHALQLGGGEAALDVVRERLGLTGAKRGCGHGACGACTVLVDGAPHASCLLPGVALDGRSVTTIEAVGGADLHPVQRAFLAEDGLQCGYCTPGFVVSAVAFHDAWRAKHAGARPSAAEVADALEGNLCRCGAHPRILAAVARACAGEFDAPSTVPPVRVDAVAKVTGRARYTTDVKLDGQLEGLILRSPHGSATLTALDLDALRAAPGVKAVVAYVNVGGVVRFAGQEVLAVAAVDRAAGLAAIEGARITWTPSTPVVGMAAARAAGATPVFATKKALDDAPSAAEGAVFPGALAGNLRGPVRLPFARVAQVEERLAAARTSGTAYKETFSAHSQCHTTLEPHAAVARWLDGGLEVWVSTQSVHDLAVDLSEHYALPTGAVRVHAEYVGAGFGAKVGMQMESRVACDLAKLAGAPVRVVLDRAAEIAVAGVRPGADFEIELGATADGALAALRGVAYGDGGVSVGSSVAVLARLVYDSPYKDLVDYDVLSNAPPVKPFRGPGGPAALWALEQAVDAIAWKRGEDPVALRRRWTPHAGRQRLYDWVDTLPAWKERAREVGADKGRYRRGFGFATGVWMPMVQTGVEVRLEASRDGIVAASACQDMGNGSKSVVAYAVAETLGIAPDQVRVRFGDSADPASCASSGSRTAVSMGPAAEEAASELHAALVAVAEDRLGLRDAVAAPGGVKHAAGFVSVADLLAASPPITVTGRRRRDPGGYYLPFAASGLRFFDETPAAAQVTEVELDTRTGIVRARRSWTGISAGRIKVPQMARTQVEGAVVQGVSYALYEERRLDPATGRTLTADLETYRIAGLADAPEMDVHFDEGGFEGVLGNGIGLSEAATVAVAASIGNALYHATGQRPTRLPLRPDSFLEVRS
jgi:xanthine dehydrogenase YagR molybdenum-binding subunit